MDAPHALNETWNNFEASHKTDNESSGSDTAPCAPCHSADGSFRSPVAFAGAGTQDGSSWRPTPTTMSVATLDPSLLSPIHLDLDLQDLSSSSRAAESAPNSSGLERTVEVRQAASGGVQNPAAETLGKRLLKAVPPLMLASSPMGASPVSFAKQIVTASPFSSDAEKGSEDAANSGQDSEIGRCQIAPSSSRSLSAALSPSPIGIRDTHESLRDIIRGQAPYLRRQSTESVYFSAASSAERDEGNDDADASYTAVTPQSQGTGVTRDVKLFIV
jgi:hypothetical protein